MLAVGLDEETLSRVSCLFGGEQTALQVAAQARDGVGRARRQRFDLVACSYPLPDMVLRSFASLLRQADSASRDAALLVLSLSDMRTEARMGLPRGRSMVMSRQDPARLLDETVRHLLRVKPRREISLPVKLSYPGEAGDAEIAAQTINLSLSGMLVYHPDLPPLHSPCSFSLRTPQLEQGIHGTGTVVRHSSARRERAGFAVRFEELGDDADQLATLIENG